MAALVKDGAIYHLAYKWDGSHFQTICREALPVSDEIFDADGLTCCPRCERVYVQSQR